jgi:Na+-driven multidrug efflux pump
MILFALLFSDFIYNLWIGEKVAIPWGISFQFAIYAILMTWTSIFTQFMNGIGIIKLQLIIALIQCIIVIPLSIFLAKDLGIGSAGVVLSINLNMLLPAVLLYVQANKIMNKRAHGVWIS